MSTFLGQCIIYLFHTITFIDQPVLTTGNSMYSQLVNKLLVTTNG